MQPPQMDLGLQILNQLVEFLDAEVDDCADDMRAAMDLGLTKTRGHQDNYIRHKTLQKIKDWLVLELTVTTSKDPNKQYSEVADGEG